MENKIYDEKNINRERHNNLRKSTNEHKKEIINSLCNKCDGIVKLLKILEEKEEEENIITSKSSDVKISAIKKEENLEEIYENLIKTFFKKKSLEAINNKYIVINPFSEEDKKFIRLISKFSHIIPTKIKIHKNEDPIDVFELKIMWDRAEEKMKKFKKTPKKYRFLIIPTHLSLLFYGNLTKENIKEAKKLINKTEENIIKENLDKVASNAGDIVTMATFAFSPLLIPLIARGITPHPSKISLSWWQRFKQNIYDKYEKVKSKIVENNEFARRFIESSWWHKFMDKHFNERKKEYNKQLYKNIALLISGINLAKTIYDLSRYQPIDIRGAIETETQFYKQSNLKEVGHISKEVMEGFLESVHQGLSQIIPQHYLNLYNYFDHVIAPPLELYKSSKIEEELKKIPFHKKIFLSFWGTILHGTPNLKKIANKLTKQDVEKTKHQLKVLASLLTLMYANNIESFQNIPKYSYSGYIKNLEPKIEQTVS